MTEKDKRIKELDIEVQLQAEIIQHMLENHFPLAIYEELKEFIVKRQDNTAQKQIELLRTQKQILLRKIMELYDRLADKN
jgi:hypothetical protein